MGEVQDALGDAAEQHRADLIGGRTGRISVLTCGAKPASAPFVGEAGIASISQEA